VHLLPANFTGGGFNATTTGASFSGPFVFGKASIIMINGWVPERG
jgi:hypothetical protein